MNHKAILDQLNSKLIENIRIYYPLIKNNDSRNINKEVILVSEKSIQCILKLIKQEIAKSKSLNSNTIY